MTWHAISDVLGCSRGVFYNSDRYRRCSRNLSVSLTAFPLVHDTEASFFAVELSLILPNQDVADSIAPPKQPYDQIEVKAPLSGVISTTPYKEAFSLRPSPLNGVPSIDYLRVMFGPQTGPRPLTRGCLINLSSTRTPQRSCRALSICIRREICSDWLGTGRCLDCFF